MAEINKESAEHTGIENVGQALSRAEQYIEKNSKVITIAAIALFVVVGGYFGYKKWYLAPLEKEAQIQMFVAEQYFEKDSFNIALNGDGNNWGFIKIIDEYGLTKSAKLSKAYAGICYLHLGQFQKSIDLLDSYSSDDKLLGPVAIGAKGDAYAELGKKDKALDAYLDAANKYKNDFTSPIYLMKAGIECEALNNFSKALEVYKIIKEKYPRSYEGRQIDKFITRAELLQASGK